MLALRGEQAGALELRDLPAHGLHGEAEIVRDVGAAHRDLDDGGLVGLLADAIRQHDEERGDALGRGLAAQEQHPIEGAVEGLGGVLEQPPLQMRPSVHALAQAVLIEHAELDPVHRLGERRVLPRQHRAEEIPAEEEAGDLLAAVGQELEELDRAAEDVGDLTDAGVLLDDEFARLEDLVRRHGVELLQLRRTEHGTERGLTDAADRAAARRHLLEPQATLLGGGTTHSHDSIRATESTLGSTVLSCARMPRPARAAGSRAAASIGRGGGSAAVVVLRHKVA